jgi:hypothetical protein
MKNRYPRYFHRASSVEERQKDPSLFRSVIIHSEVEEEALGPEFVEDLVKIPEMKAKFHLDEPVEAAMDPSEEAVDEKPVHEMSEEELREVLISKHGYNPKKLAKKSKEQLLAIFSS